ncbi:MAG: hypothetical protein LBD11_04020 [Candidatus Peribacteria bacterium]|jgi:hypothetical protein|nr:hypothetical protein [Candidatus Peribacteria bacterium]
MVVKLPEGKEFDKNSLQVYPYDQTILIQETKGNQHQYDFKFSANGYFILDERPMN